MTYTISNPGFSPKAPAEIVTVAFDFASLTTAPTSPVVTATRHAGAADATPSAVLSGSPSVSGSKILHKVIAGTDGTDYLLTCKVDTASGDRYILAGVLPVRAA